MPSTIRKVSYAYVTAASKPGEAARILQALRDGTVNLLAFSGFPQGRSKAQIDVVTDDLEALKDLARRQKWKLSRIKRAFLVQDRLFLFRVQTRERWGLGHLEEVISCQFSVFSLPGLQN